MSTIAAVGAVVAVLGLAGCGGGSGAAEQGNALVGLETQAAEDSNEELVIGENMAVPPDWPAEVPVFASGSLNTVGVNADGSADAQWTTTAAPEAVFAEYEAALLAAGYTAVADTVLEIEGMAGADYTGSAYTVSVLVSASDTGVAGETSLFITVTPN
jgi:hypothetical protein